MYNKMLIPLDRSETGEVVLPYAKELAGRLGLEMTLIHVVRPERQDQASNYKPYLDNVSERLLNRAHYVQQKVGKARGSATVRVQSVLTGGNPAEEILRYTEDNKVDLILMATHGRSGVSRWAVGSVADKVTRRSDVPVFLVRAGTSKPVLPDRWAKMTMVVPLDGSQLAEAVLPHVENLAKQRGVDPEVVLVRVGEEPLSDQRKKEYAEYLSGVEQRLGASVRSVRSEILEGDPAAAIIEYANGNSVNLIVMATHGRSGADRWAYGSVADRVLRRAQRPLLLVRVARPMW